MRQHTPEDFAKLRALLVEARKEIESGVYYARPDGESEVSYQEWEEWKRHTDICFKIDDALAEMDSDPKPDSD